MMPAKKRPPPNSKLEQFGFTKKSKAPAAAVIEEEHVAHVDNNNNNVNDVNVTTSGAGKTRFDTDNKSIDRLSIDLFISLSVCIFKRTNNCMTVHYRFTAAVKCTKSI